MLELVALTGGPLWNVQLADAVAARHHLVIEAVEHVFLGGETHPVELE